jgi:hypothetical protein
MLAIAAGRSVRDGSVWEFEECREDFCSLPPSPRWLPPRRAMPDLPTFEEFFESVHHKKPSGFLYEVLRTSSDPLVAMFRTALLPPRSPAEITSVMRSAFVALAQDKDFIRDYSNAVKTDPLVVPGVDAQEIVTALGTVKPEIKAFVIDYTSKLVK